MNSDTVDELSIHCKVTNGKLGWLFPIGFFIVWIVLAYRSTWRWSGVAFGLFATGTWIWHWWEPVDVELLVTVRGFQSFGNFGGGYNPVRQLLWSDVIRIQYQRGTGGEDDYSPAGLWAVGTSVSTCFLPGLDEEETSRIAATIYERFPNVTMAVDTGYGGLFKADVLISLGLSGK